ncbi:MAG: M28 family peptidase [Kofleriaceae bacterium]|nr:M28 family peptidase [Kofleriaceae bacterium]
MRRDWVLVVLLLLCSCGGKASPQAADPFPRAVAIGSEVPSSPFAEAALLEEATRLCAPDFAGRGSYQQGSALASQYVYDELAKLGYEMHRQAIRGHAETIIAVKRGDENAVLISAHHDHLGTQKGDVYLGADDNASGLAALLAIARSRAQLSYKHTLLFVSFGAEEDGLVGSGAYVREPFWPLAKTVAVINFDMVGRNFFEAGANQQAAVAVVGLEASSVARDATLSDAQERGLSVIEVPARLLEIFYLHDRTDDWWFRRQGITAIHFSTGMHQDYHQPSDTVDKLQFGQISRIAQTAAATLDALAQRDP